MFVVEYLFLDTERIYMTKLYLEHSDEHIYVDGGYTGVNVPLLIAELKEDISFDTMHLLAKYPELKEYLPKRIKRMYF